MQMDGKLICLVIHRERYANPTPYLVRVVWFCRSLRHATWLIFHWPGSNRGSWLTHRTGKLVSNWVR